MNEKMRENFEKRLDDMLRNLSPSQQIAKLKSKLIKAYDDSYAIVRRNVRAIKYIKQNEREYGSLEDNEKIILNILIGDDK